MIPSNEIEAVNTLKLILDRQFKLKIIYCLKYFLRLKVGHRTKGISLSKIKYTLKFLSNNVHLVVNLLKHPWRRILIYLGLMVHLLISKIYRRLVGRLLYLTITSLNIHLLFIHSTRSWIHLSNLISMLHTKCCTIKSSPSQGLFFSTTTSLHLNAFTNFNWVAFNDTKCFINSFCIFIGTSLVSWKPNKIGHCVMIIGQGRILNHGYNKNWVGLDFFLNPWFISLSHCYFIIILWQQSCHLYSL